MWYDYRLGSNNRDVYYSASRDQGTTWETNTRVTSTYGPAATYAGDYVGCIASQNDKAIAVWGDTRISANQEVYSSVLTMLIPSAIIVDDVNAVFVGSWTLSTATSGYYGSGYRYHAAGTGANTATWSFNIPTAGSWEVYARWTSSSTRATNALYTIYHATRYPLWTVSLTGVQLNQQVNGGSWQSLGTYPFDAGAYWVRLSDSANGIVVADAIRLVSWDSPPPPPPPPSTLTVTSPNGGQNWIRGTTHTITWSSTGSPGANVKIELLKGGAVNKVLTSSTANDGSYSWTISSTQTLGTDYKVGITSTSNTAITDSSNSNFAVVAGTLTVTTPNGGNSWKRGSVYTITWTKSGSPGSYLKIELLKGGVVNRVIASSTANDGSFSWTIPSTQTTGTDYKIRITSTTYSSITDSSNSNYAITA
jgi:5-hydroxyisourate hydrolase-like protein (transthyretin family)